MHSGLNVFIDIINDRCSARNDAGDRPWRRIAISRVYVFLLHRLHVRQGIYVSAKVSFMC